MDRRSTLATLLGKKKLSSKSTTTTLAGLEPYTGAWELEHAAHLLRRTTFGMPYARIKEVVQNGMVASVAQLLSLKPMPDPPVNYFFPNDPNVPVGTSWIDAPYSLTVDYLNYRFRSLSGWTMGLMLQDGLSIREKMVLFWHNHFVTSDINEPRFIYDYSKLLRTHALGNFKEFTKAMTINPLMLRYLNGNQNTKDAPNENYARELLELFTIGKGDLAGPGDYSTFTEDDVVQIARVLTGWVDRGFYDLIGNPVSSEFRPFRHDTGSKQLSHRFGSAIINNQGDQEYRALIDIIFEQPEVARFICRKLYRWFVFYEIPEEVELNVIEPMAQLLIDNDFEVLPVLEALFTCAHFYEEAQRGCMIKNPMDFILPLVRQLEVDLPVSLPARYETGIAIGRFATLQLMEYYRPPNVAGWAAYYQEPSFYQLWINSVSLPQRMQLAAGLVLTGYMILGEKLIVDPLALVNSIDQSADPNAVVEEFATLLFTHPLSDDQKIYLKGVLIPGLPDFEWEVEYLEYAADPGNEALANPVRTKLRNLLTVILTMPEYFMM